MNLRTLVPWTLALPALLLFVGCGGGGTSNSPPTTLTSSQQQAVQTAVTQTMTTAALLSPLSQVDRAIPSATGGCPQVSVAHNGTGASVTVDYGAAGCTGGPQGNVTYTGAVIGTVDTAAHTATVAFDHLTVDGDPVNGTISLSAIQLTPEATSARTDMDLTVGSVGHITGNSAFSLAQGGALTISSTDLALTPNSGPAETVSLSHVVVNPQANGNFAPQSGTAVVTYADGPGGQTTLLVTFGPQTPKDGTVTVSVDGSPPITYQAPDVPHGH